MFLLFILIFASNSAEVEPKGKIIPGYGIEFEEIKQISLGVNVIDVIIQVPLPNVTFKSAAADIFRKIQSNCNSIDDKRVKEICANALPRFQMYKMHEYVISSQQHDKLAILRSMLPNAQIDLPEVRKPNWGKSNQPDKTFAEMQMEYVRKFRSQIVPEGEGSPQKKKEDQVQDQVQVPDDMKPESIPNVEVSDNSANDLYNGTDFECISTIGNPKLKMWNEMVSSWHFGNCTTKYTIQYLEAASLRVEFDRIAEASLTLQEKEFVTVQRTEVLEASNGTLQRLLRTRKANIKRLQRLFEVVRALGTRPSNVESVQWQKRSFNYFVLTIKNASMNVINEYQSWYDKLQFSKATRFQILHPDESTSAALRELIDRLRTRINARKAQQRALRKKRTVSLFSSIFAVVRVEQLAKAVRALNKLSSANADELQLVRQDMIVITKHLQQGMKKTVRQLSEFQASMKQVIDNFARMVNQSDAELDQLHIVMLKIYYFNIFADVLDPMVQREAWIQQVQLEQVNEFIRAVNTLIQKRLPTFLVKPEALEDMIRKTMRKVNRYHPGYDLLFPDVNSNYEHEYIGFTHDKENLYIQIPVFLEPRARQNMTLYKVKTVPVPFQSKSEATKGKTLNFYTKIKVETPYIAINHIAHLEMTTPEVRQCIEIHNRIVCVKTSLQYDYTAPTCLSTLFYQNAKRNEITQLCEFMVVQPEQVRTDVLETTDLILLANAKTPWKMICRPNIQIPKVVREQEYVIIHRKDLCNCRIDATDFILPERIDACEENKTRPTFRFTVNQALIGYWNELNDRFSQNISELFNHPPELILPHVTIKKMTFPSVLNKDWKNYETSLSSFMDTIKKHSEVWNDKSSKLKAELVDIQNLKFTNIFKVFNWFGKWWKIFVAVTIIVSVLIFTVCCVSYLHLKETMAATRTGLGTYVFRSRPHGQSLIRRVRRRNHNQLEQSLNTQHDNEGFENEQTQTSSL